MIPGHLLSAFPYRQFHTLPGLLDSWAALPNSNPNACMPMQGGSLYHFYDGLWYDPAERRTHDLPCERRTRYRLSQPDTVMAVMTILVKCIKHSLYKNSMTCFRASRNILCISLIQNTPQCILPQQHFRREFLLADYNMCTVCLQQRTLECIKT